MAEVGPVNVLLHNFLTVTSGSEAVCIVKRDGNVFTSIIRPGSDEKIGGLTSLIRYIADVLKIDFETGYFRKSVQEISAEHWGFIFQQINPEMVLITIYDENANKRLLTAYSVYIANKVNQIMKGDLVSTEVPKSEAEMKEKMKPRNSFIFKIVIIGDAGVGKTTTTIQFAQSKFNSEYMPTIGVSIVKNEYLFGDNLVNFQIWDIAGQQYWQPMRKIYYGGSQGALILYDVTRPLSFQNVRKWHQELKEFLPNKIPQVLVANKIDLEDLRKISKAEGEALAAELNMPYFEISAKTAENLERAFSHLGELLIEDFTRKQSKKA
jgi:small GTP-binding protein